MQNFIYNTPTKIYFGENEEYNLHNILNEYGYKKILFHYGKLSIKRTGLYDIVIDELKKADVEYIELGGVEANPKLSLVEKGVKLAKENEIDFILAVGGGSVIDSAKAIADGFYVEHSPWLFNSGEKKVKKALPIGVILTISAAGSEMSNSCVITNDITNDKRGFTSEYNRPLFAIMNPRLTFTVSKYQTACGITDIIMHTLERVISSPEINNPLTDSLAFALIKNVIEAGIKAYDDPEDYQARAILMWASSLSHNGLTGCGRNYVMSVHQMEHAVSGLFDHVSHGAGLAVLWPAWAMLASEKAPERFAELAYQTFGLSREVNINDAAKYSIRQMREFFSKIDMPTKLSEFGIKEEDLSEIAKLYTFNGKRTLTDIIEIDYTKCLEILELCY